MRWLTPHLEEEDVKDWERWRKEGRGGVREDKRMREGKGEG